MRPLILLFALMLPLCAVAQQPLMQNPPPQGSNWQHVLALPLGTSIQVKARKSSLGCKLTSVDSDSLTCKHWKDVVFQRTDIVSIKIPHRWLSTLLGFGIGAGVGAAIGAGVTKSCANGCIAITRGQAVAIVALGGGVIGAPIGLLTDLTRSTVYKAP